MKLETTFSSETLVEFQRLDGVISQKAESFVFNIECKVVVKVAKRGISEKQSLS
jgi:hypothetical protein